MLKIISKLYKKLIFIIFKSKKFNNEDDYYKFLFKYNPSWNSIEPNEDETIRWNEIIECLNIFCEKKDKIKILEIGSGRGWLLNLLYKNNFNAVGVEPVKSVVEYSKKIYPNIEIYISGIPNLLKLFENRKFDFIISSEVIEHIEDKDLFFSCCGKLLNTNGTLIFTTPIGDNYNEFVESFGEDPDQPIEEWMTIQDIEYYVKKNNFEILHTKYFNPLPLDRLVNISQLVCCKLNRSF